jgi:hypothetical protein
MKEKKESGTDLGSRTQAMIRVYGIQTRHACRYEQAGGFVERKNAWDRHGSRVGFEPTKNGKLAREPCAFPLFRGIFAIIQTAHQSTKEDRTPTSEFNIHNLHKCERWNSNYGPTYGIREVRRLAHPGCDGLLIQKLTHARYD